MAQKYECYRSRTHEDGQIGFTIYEVPPGMPRVTPQYVSDQMPLDCAELQTIREVATFFALPPGDFIVLPHSLPHREGKFLLRILADQHADVWEVNDDNVVVHNIGGAEFGGVPTGQQQGVGAGDGRSVVVDDRTSDGVSWIIGIGFICIYAEDAIPTFVTAHDLQASLALLLRNRCRPAAAHPQQQQLYDQEPARLWHARQQCTVAGLVPSVAGATRSRPGRSPVRRACARAHAVAQVLEGGLSALWSKRCADAAPWRLVIEGAVVSATWVAVDGRRDGQQ